MGALLERAQQEFANLLEEAMRRGPLTEEIYQRYLSMQYHLTKGVQRYFLVAAAHESLVKRRKFRKFLTDFAFEEELHFLIAKSDLEELGLDVLPEPLDVLLWHSYFQSVVVERPYIRLGAACVLENIASGPARKSIGEALKSPFLTRNNTKFLTLHQHEAVPHGAAILEAISRAKLEESECSDLMRGVRVGTVLYLRMVEWALDCDALSTVADDFIRFSYSRSGRTDSCCGEVAGDHAE